MSTRMQTRFHRPLHALQLAALAVALAAGVAACGSSSPTPTTTSTTTTTVPKTPATLGSLLPLFPFASAAQVDSWAARYTSSGADAWHLSAAQTALRFTAWLGFADVSRTFGAVSGRDGAHVTVGFVVAGTTTKVRAAVVHLVRWGSGTAAPWEVVGTDDTTFSLTAPAYGATVGSPITAGGLISGVDENVKVRVRTLSSTADVGTSCCTAAGGVATYWSRQVAYTAPAGSVVTVIAQTGGHVATVERFTITGLKVP